MNPIGCKDKCWPDENIEKELHKMVVYANGADTKIVYIILACSFIYQTNVFMIQLWPNFSINVSIVSIINDLYIYI